MNIDALESVRPRGAAALLLDVLRSEGVRYIFGNPGTTEMPLLRALNDSPDLSYVLGLQESSVVSMARSDGASSIRSSRMVKVVPDITGRADCQFVVATIV